MKSVKRLWKGKERFMSKRGNRGTKLLDSDFSQKPRRKDIIIKVIFTFPTQKVQKFLTTVKTGVYISITVRMNI